MVEQYQTSLYALIYVLQFSVVLYVFICVHSVNQNKNVSLPRMMSKGMGKNENK